ncbi:hypothetical protein SFRURICE_003594, partial [Spodoptera frugiperda]
LQMELVTKLKELRVAVGRGKIDEVKNIVKWFEQDVDRIRTLSKAYENTRACPTQDDLVIAACSHNQKHVLDYLLSQTDILYYLTDSTQNITEVIEKRTEAVRHALRLEDFEMVVKLYDYWIGDLYWKGHEKDNFKMLGKILNGVISSKNISAKNVFDQQLIIDFESLIKYNDFQQELYNTLPSPLSHYAVTEHTAAEGTGTVNTATEGTNVTDTVVKETARVILKLLNIYDKYSVIDKVIGEMVKAEGTGGESSHLSKETNTLLQIAISADTIKHLQGIREFLSHANKGQLSIRIDIEDNQADMKYQKGDDDKGTNNTSAEATAAKDTAEEKTEAEDTVAEKIVAEYTTAEDTAVEDTAVGKTAAEDTAVEKIVAEYTTAEDTAVEKTVAEYTTAEDTAVEDTAAGKTAAEDTVAEKTVAEYTTAEDTAVEKTVAEFTTAEDTAVEDTAAGKTAAEDTAIEKTVTEYTTAEDTAVEKTVAEYTTAEDTAVEDTAAGKTAAEDTAVEKTVAEYTTAEDTSRQKTELSAELYKPQKTLAVEDTAAGKTAAEDTAVEKTVAEYTTAEDTVAEKTVAEYTTAEDTAVEDTAAEKTATEDTAAETTAVHWKSVLELANLVKNYRNDSPNTENINTIIERVRDVCPGSNQSTNNTFTGIKNLNEEVEKKSKTYIEVKEYTKRHELTTCLINRIKRLRATLRYPEQIPLRELVQLYKLDPKFRFNLEMLLGDIENVMNITKRNSRKSGKLLEGIVLRNVLYHGNPFLEVIGDLIDSQDLPRELLAKAISYADDQEAVEALEALFQHNVDFDTINDGTLANMNDALKGYYSKFIKSQNWKSYAMLLKIKPKRIKEIKQKTVNKQTVANHSSKNKIS